jgi:hypothetical protein
MGNDPPGGMLREAKAKDGEKPVRLTSADMLRQAAAINEAKNAEYGNGYINHGDVMAGLFPAGVHLLNPADFARFALLDLIVVKLVRYCRNFSMGHDDSLLDISVYAAMLRETDDACFDNRG